MMRLHRILAISFVVSIILFTGPHPNLSNFYSAADSSTLPAYATIGAFANYTGSGGYIAFLSGVSGNLSYTVTNVLANGSMELYVNGNLSLGTEVDIPTSQISENLTDSIYSPKIFPALPPQELTSKQIIFQNITCEFQTDSVLTVPAGTFEAVEYQGTGVNDSILDFWFDNSTGLAIQMSGSGAELQLTGSNIAQPFALQSSSAFDLSIVAVFLVGWTIAGLLFYAVRRHYIKKSEADGFMPRKGEGPAKVYREKIQR